MIDDKKVLKDISNRMGKNTGPSEQSRVAEIYVSAMVSAINYELESQFKCTFPSLEECEKYVRDGLSDKTLTDQDEHVIGSVWAFVKGRMEIGNED